MSRQSLVQASRLGIMLVLWIAPLGTARSGDGVVVSRRLYKRIL